MREMTEQKLLTTNGCRQSTVTRRGLHVSQCPAAGTVCVGWKVCKYPLRDKHGGTGGGAGTERKVKDPGNTVGDLNVGDSVSSSAIERHRGSPLDL